jgi:uncharacterized protein YgiB involved in biofilm formation
MKRSRVVRLVLMGMAPVALSACSDPSVPALVYRDAQDCARDGVSTAAICQKRHYDALVASRTEAPRYARRQDCVADFGEMQCEREAHAGYYSPRINGFMFAADARNAQTPRPVYKGRSGEFITADGLYAGTNTGTVRVHPQALQPQHGVTLSRAGFGQVSAARGSFGG